MDRPVNSPSPHRDQAPGLRGSTPPRTHADYVEQDKQTLLAILTEAGLGDEAKQYFSRPDGVERFREHLNGRRLVLTDHASVIKEFKTFALKWEPTEPQAKDSRATGRAQRFFLEAPPPEGSRDELRAAFAQEGTFVGLCDAHIDAFLIQVGKRGLEMSDKTEIINLHHAFAAAASVNAYEEDGLVPIHRAVMADDLAEVTRLLKNSADPTLSVRKSINAVDGKYRNLNALTLAIACDANGEVVSAISLWVVKRRDAGNHACNVLDEPDVGGNTPLTMAIDNLGAWNTSDKGKNAAREQKERALIDLLIDFGAAINAPNGRGDTPLMRAARKSDILLVERLIGQGANPAGAIPLALFGRSQENRAANTLVLIRLMEPSAKELIDLPGQRKPAAFKSVMESAIKIRSLAVEEKDAELKVASDKCVSACSDAFESVWRCACLYSGADERNDILCLGGQDKDEDFVKKVCVSVFPAVLEEGMNEIRSLHAVGRTDDAIELFLQLNDVAIEDYYVEGPVPALALHLSKLPAALRTSAINALPPDERMSMDKKIQKALKRPPPVMRHPAPTNNDIAQMLESSSPYLHGLAEDIFAERAALARNPAARSDETSDSSDDESD